jgi:hypothetical protein
MRVVEQVVPHPYFHRRESLPALVGAIDRAERGGNLRVACIVHGVRAVIGGHRLIAQHLHIPLQFRLENADERCGLRGRTIDKAHENDGRGDSVFHGKSD